MSPEGVNMFSISLAARSRISTSFCMLPLVCRFAPRYFVVVTCGIRWLSANVNSAGP